MSDSPEAVEQFKALMSDPAARAAFVELKARRDEEGIGLRYANIRRIVAQSAWAITPEAYGQIIEILTLRASGIRFDAEEIAERIGAARPNRQPQAAGGVAVLPIQGAIIPKAGMMSEISGGTSVEGFREMFRAAMSTSDVASIVLNIDSPGGMVDQIPEMAAEIRGARGQKRIVAVANTKALSAAYWLASQADQLVVTPSGRVGSVGVISEHEDISRMQEMEGVKTTLITYGKYKAEGNPYEPLSAEAKAYQQEMVNTFGAMFVADVAAGRGLKAQEVADRFAQGRSVLAQDAVSAGMADEIGTLDAVVTRLLELGASKAPAVVAAADPWGGVDKAVAAAGQAAKTSGEVHARLDLPPWSVFGALEGVSDPVLAHPESLLAHLESGEAHDVHLGTGDFATLTSEHRRLHMVVGVNHTHPGMMSILSGEFGATAIPAHSTDTVKAPWDGPGNKSRLKSGDEANLRAAFAWYDASGADPNEDGYPDAKDDYAFIHHEVSADGTAGAANEDGCTTAIGELNGARNGDPTSQRWSEDRKGIHSHLAAHLSDAGVDPIPPLKGENEAPDVTSSADPGPETAQTDSHVDQLAARLRLAGL